MPNTLLLAPGLVVDKIYVGYWYWVARRRTSSGSTSRTSSAGDYDPTTPEAKAAWEAAQAVAV